MRANAIKTAITLGAPVFCFVAGVMDIEHLQLVVAVAMTLCLWVTTNTQEATGRFARFSVVLFGAGTTLIYLQDGIAFYAGVLWLAAALPAVLSRRQEAPAGAMALMLSGVLVFSFGATMLTGPIGMTALLAGLAWLLMDVCEQDELRQSSLEASAA